jgi:hypothetical protein
MASSPEHDFERQRRLLERVTQAKAGTERPQRGGSRPSFPRWALSAGAEGSWHSRRVMGAPPVCPLERAFGRDTACAGLACVFYRVPGTRMDCAVEQWSPRAEHEPEIAAWFAEVRGGATPDERAGSPD